MYLQNTIKVKTAKNLIADLTKSSDQTTMMKLSSSFKRGMTDHDKFIRHTCIVSSKHHHSKMVQAKRAMHYMM